jgi:hypothetical protein
MRYWDNDIDRLIDEALDALFWEEKARQARELIDIGNPVKVIGAQ